MSLSSVLFAQSLAAGWESMRFEESLGLISHYHTNAHIQLLPSYTVRREQGVLDGSEKKDLEKIIEVKLV